MSKIINSFNIDDVPFEDTRDFINANRGFIATRKDPLIKNKKGRCIKSNAAISDNEDKTYLCSNHTINLCIYIVQVATAQI